MSFIFLLWMYEINGDDKPDAENFEWSMGRGNPGLTGVSSDTSVKPPFRRRWAYLTPAANCKAELCVTAGRVFVISSKGPILALDADTGKLCWVRLDLGINYTRSAPSCDGTRAFFLVNKELQALDAATGTTLWKYTAIKRKRVNYYKPTTVFAEGKVFFYRMDEKSLFAVALKAEDGTEVWARKIGGADWDIREPCYADGLVYYRVANKKGDQGHVVALKAADGSIAWKRDDLPTKGYWKYEACASDGQIVGCPTYYNNQSPVLDAKTGKTLWITGARGCAAWFVIASKHILTGNFGAGPTFFAYNRESGKRLWTAKVQGGSSNCSVPSVSGSYAFVGMGTPKMPGSISGFGRYSVSSVGAVNLENGALVWSYRLDGGMCANPAIAYGRLYSCGGGGWIYCLEPVEKAPTPPPAPDFEIAGLRKTYKKPVYPTGPGRGATFKGKDKPAGGNSWPMYGGCPERCGLELTIKTPITPAWKFDTGGEVHCSAAIADGTAFVGSDSGKLFALNLGTGKKKWEFAAGGTVQSSPAVANGLVVFGSDAGKLYAVDAKSGRKKWDFTTGDWIRTAPAIAEDKVVFGSWDRCIYALNLADGKQLWHFATNHKIRAAPAVYKNRVFVASDDWVLYALDLASGKLQWHFLRRGPAAGVAVYRDMVATLPLGRTPFVCPESGALAMKRVTGLGVDGAYFGAPAFSGDWLFSGHWWSGHGWGHSWGGVGVLNLKEAKSYNPSLQSKGVGCLETPLCTKDLMVLATIKGTVEAYTIFDGKNRAKKLWEWKTPSGKMFHTAPAAAGGYIVVGNDDGFVYGFRYSQ